MSDYEEEHFPIGIRPSFSSSFDVDMRESSGGTDFPPIRRSFSEYYRGERITVDAIGSHYEDEFRKESKDEIQNSLNSNIFLDDLSSSHAMKFGFGNSDFATSRSGVPVGGQHVSCQSETDMQVDSSVSESCSVNGESVTNGYDKVGADNTSAAVSCAKLYAYQSDTLSATGRSEAFVHSEFNSNDLCQRTVSEIRNNIPSVGTVKSCSDSGYEIRQSSPDTVLRGEFARFRKRSPGVAKRLEATTPSQDTAVISLAEEYEPDMAAVSKSALDSDGSMVTQSSVLSATASSSGIAPTEDVEAVFRRKELTKNDNISEVMSAWDSLSDDTARLTDPFRYSGMLPDAVLFISADDPVADHTIRLSPELTECDSDNVSTLEEDNVVDVADACLPVVEDGLSCSDTDDVPTSSTLSSVADSAACSHRFPVSETEVMDFFSGTVDSVSDTTAVKDSDPVERAIRDIRLAMERSKEFAAGDHRLSHSLNLQCSHDDAEAVWVSRAEYVATLCVANNQQLFAIVKIYAHLD